MRALPGWILCGAFLSRTWLSTAGVVHFEDTKNRIVDGKVAPLGRYPYAVTLQRGFGSHVCGGSLIAPDIVLTAAHCGFMQEAHIARNNVGADNVISETFSIESRVYHPRYDYDSKDFDLSIIKLLGESSIPPVMLNRNPSFPGDGFPVTIMGWGRTNATDATSTSTNLQEATLVTISNEECRGLWNDNVKDHMFCMASDDQGVGCQGDSGSPVILAGSTSASDLQLGVLSWGPDTCDITRFPSVSQRITSELSWIESVVCEMSSNPPEDFACDDTFTISPSPTSAPTGPTSSPAPTTTKVPVRVFITLDNFPQEFGWKIEDDSGVKIAGENPGFYSIEAARIEQTVFLEFGKTYTFTAIDIAGDGMCCEEGNGNYRVVLEDNDRTLVSGNGIFQGVKRHKFVVLDVNESTLLPSIFPFETTGNFPISVQFRLDGNPELFGWKVQRIDLSDRRLIVNVPPGSYTEVGENVFDTLFLEEGGLYQITFFDDGFDGTRDSIDIRLGSSTGKVLSIPGTFSEPQKVTFVASPSGEPTLPTLGDQTLNLFLRFDSFPEEVGWFLMAGPAGLSNETSEELSETISADRLQVPTDEFHVVAFGPPGQYDGEVANRELTETINLPRLDATERDFVLVVHDSFGDGMCCVFGDGFYNLYYGPEENEIVMYSSTVDSTEREIFNFTLTSAGPSVPTSAPTLPSTSGSDTRIGIWMLPSIGAVLGFSFLV